MAGFGEAEARAARDNKLAQIANELLLLPPDEQARAMDAALAELGGAEDAAAFFGPTLDLHFLKNHGSYAARWRSQRVRVRIFCGTLPRRASDCNSFSRNC
jgi:hypothetical protein